MILSANGDQAAIAAEADGGIFQRHFQAARKTLADRGEGRDAGGQRVLHHAAKLIERGLCDGFGPAPTVPGAQSLARDPLGYDGVLDDAVTIKPDCDVRLDEIYAGHGWVNQ